MPSSSYTIWLGLFLVEGKPVPLASLCLGYGQPGKSGDSAILEGGIVTQQRKPSHRWSPAWHTLPRAVLIPTHKGHFCLLRVGWWQLSLWGGREHVCLLILSCPQPLLMPPRALWPPKPCCVQCRVFWPMSPASHPPAPPQSRVPSDHDVRADYSMPGPLPQRTSWRSWAKRETEA